ncbi:MAG: hypothetical protein ACON35_08120 [Candidatus Marinamargulisbacteria bacterium]
MRFVKLLLLPLLFSACSELAPDSVIMSDDISAYMEFKTERINAGGDTNSITVSLEANGNAVEVSSVKLNGTNMTFASDSYTDSTTTFTVGDTHDIDCYLNQSDVFFSENVEDSKITLKTLPEFKIKIANQLSGLASAVAVNAVATISKTKVIGIVFENNDDYQVTAKASVENTAKNQSSGDFTIEDGGFVNSNLLDGTAVGFVPNKLILDVSFYYDGTLNAAFKRGHIRRIVNLKKEIPITD